MRRMGTLRTPLPANRRELIYKVMLHETRRNGVFAYLYTSPDALLCSYDCHYPDLANAMEDWADEVERWDELDDPLPHCQHDCPLPVRVKGCEEGRPQWGSYEILKDGKWRDFAP